MTAGTASVRRSAPLHVHVTVDVEVWCDGWDNIDAKFPACFAQYIHGHTPTGDYGTGFQARRLKEHGLRGTFFVEPLFSLRFGPDWLSEVVAHVLAEGQDLQLHLHTEWVDEAKHPPLPVHMGKRQYLRQFSEPEQVHLLNLGTDLLRCAGAPRPTCFRAGSFGFNAQTLAALERSGIAMDASYNATMFGPDSGVAPGRILTDSVQIGAVCEFPMTVFKDGTQRLRHAQLTACSWRELESLLWQALEGGQDSFVLLSHGSELLTRSRSKPDMVVVRRFEQLCRFLERNSDCFKTRTFDQGQPTGRQEQPLPLQSSAWATGLRIAEQLWRRRPGAA
jgi:hypothetical protein